MYSTTITLDLPFSDAIAQVKDALADQGFGILSEIDVQTAFAGKLGEEAAQKLGGYVILGACNPQLASRGLEADPSLGVLLPCNVVVRRAPGDDRTTVDAIDPQTMVQLTDSAEVATIADDADARLRSALAALAAS